MSRVTCNRSLSFQSDTGKWETVLRTLRSRMGGKTVLCAFSSILELEMVLQTLRSRMGRKTNWAFFQFRLENLVSFEVVESFFSEHSALGIWNRKRNKHSNRPFLLFCSLLLK
ncbi:hypothetical protein C1645_746332, partial [Glomus cerebriforme]